MPRLRSWVVFVFVGLLLTGCRNAAEDLPPPPPANPLASTPEAVTPPAPATRGCQLPPGTGSGHHCPRQRSSFLREVDEAMDQVVREEPEFFDTNRARGCPKCWYVINPHRLTLRMTQILNERGLCAVYDGEEIAVKSTNDWNDQYDVLTFEMYLRRQEGSYRSTCYPAWF